MNDFVISVWNYIDADHYDFPVEKLVKEWKELQITIGCSFVCDGTTLQIEKTKELLKVAEEEHIQMWIYDKRVFYKNYQKNGTQKYEEDVKQALQDYQEFQNIFGFIIADEPDHLTLPLVVKALDSFKSLTTLHGFVNFSWCDLRMKEYGNRENYQQELIHIGQNRLSFISNDRYSCMHAKEYEKDFIEIGIDKFFADLNMFKEVANSLHVPFITSLLSCGHWMYRTPSETDIRWQLNVSFAHGVNGLMWFFIHQHRLADDYYMYPIDLYGDKTPLFDSIRRQTRYFVDKIVKPLQDYHFNKVFHIQKSYGGTPLLQKDSFDIYCYSDHQQNGILAEFVKEGKKAYLLVNNDQCYPEVFFICFKEYPEKNMHIWLDAGGSHIIFIP